MNRRDFLVTGTAGIATIVGGCNVLAGSSVSLDDPSVDGGGGDETEMHRTYSHEGRPIAVLTVDQRLAQESASDSFPLVFHLAHGEALAGAAPDTVIQRIRLALRAPRGAGRPPSEIVISPPGRESWPRVTYEVTDEGWTVLAAQSLGGDPVGDGTLTLESRVNPLGAGVQHVECRFEAVLGTGSTRFAIDDHWRVVPVVVPGSAVGGRSPGRGPLGRP